VVADAGEIRQAAGECLKRVILDKKIRLLGVRASSLTKPIEEPENQTQGQFSW
jgi:DNA polymerase-4